MNIQQKGVGKFPPGHFDNYQFLRNKYARGANGDANMQTSLPVLIGLALVFAVVLPPLSFLIYSFRKWRRAPNAHQGVVFRALSVFALLPLIYNVGYARQALLMPGGIAIEQNLQLGIACVLSLLAFLARRAIPAVLLARQPVKQAAKQ